MRNYFWKGFLLAIPLAAASPGLCLGNSRDDAQVAKTESAKIFDSVLPNAKTVIWTAFPIATGLHLLAPQFLPSLDRNRPDFSGLQCQTWFFNCKDMPQTYFGKAMGRLFGPEIRPSDIQQGELGDCYFIASLGAIVERDPDFMRRMIQDNGDGTYTVTLYDHQGEVLKPRKIRVDGQFPMRGYAPVFARYGRNEFIAGQATGTDSRSLMLHFRWEKDIIWVMVAEKALAVITGNGSYNRIGNGGFSNVALERITGKTSIYSYPISSSTFTDLMGWDKKGYAITLSTSRNPPIAAFGNGALSANHVYWVKSVDPEHRTLTVVNPVNGGLPFMITEQEFQQAFMTVSANPIH